MTLWAPQDAATSVGTGASSVVVLYPIVNGYLNSFDLRAHARREARSAKRGDSGVSPVRPESQSVKERETRNCSRSEEGRRTNNRREKIFSSARLRGFIRVSRGLIYL